MISKDRANGLRADSYVMVAMAWLFGCSAVGALGLIPARAHAHDPPLALDGDRRDAHTIITTSRGLVIGDDASGVWRLVCTEALNTTTSQSPPPRFLNADRDIALATLNGLLHADESACGWVGNPALGDRAVVNLRYDDATRRWWSVVSEPTVGGTLVSSPDGFEWTEHAVGVAPYLSDAVPAGDGTVWVSTIQQVPETGSIEFAAQPWVDEDFGDVRTMPARDDDYLVELAASSPERLTALHIAYSASGALDQLRELELTDSDDDWSVAMEALGIVGPVLYDGDWYAAAGDGVYRRQDDSYVRIVDTPLIHGIFVGDDGVYVTGEALGDWAAARVVTDEPEADLDILFLFTDIREPVLCEDAADQLCAQDWDDWFVEIFPDGLPTESDGDADANTGEDVGADTGVGDGPASCDCSTTPRRGGASALVVAALLLFRKRRRRTT